MRRRNEWRSCSRKVDELDDDDEGDLDSILASSGGILARSKSGTLAQGTLSIERLRDANISARSEGAVKTLQFHPSLFSSPNLESPGPFKFFPAYGALVRPPSSLATVTTN